MRVHVEERGRQIARSEAVVERPREPIAKHEQRASGGCRVEVANWGFWERGARGVAAALEPNGLEEHVQQVSCLGVGANVVNGRRGPTEPGRHGGSMAHGSTNNEANTKHNDGS